MFKQKLSDIKSNRFFDAFYTGFVFLVTLHRASCMMRERVHLCVQNKLLGKYS